MTEKRPTLELAAGGCTRVLDTWKRPTVVVVVEVEERRDGSAARQEPRSVQSPLWTPRDRGEEPCTVFSGLDREEEEEEEQEVEDGVTEEEETVMAASGTSLSWRTTRDERLLERSLKGTTYTKIVRHYIASITRILS